MTKHCGSDTNDPIGQLDGILGSRIWSESEKRRILHDLYQPLTAIGIYAAAGSRLTEEGASTTDEANLFARIQMQAQRMEEACHEIEDLVKALSETAEQVK